MGYLSSCTNRHLCNSSRSWESLCIRDLHGIKYELFIDVICNVDPMIFERGNKSINCYRTVGNNFKRYQFILIGLSMLEILNESTASLWVIHCRLYIISLKICNYICTFKRPKFNNSKHFIMLLLYFYHIPITNE